MELIRKNVFVHKQTKYATCELYAMLPVPQCAGRLQCSSTSATGQKSAKQTDRCSPAVHIKQAWFR